jgi:hypothetical protein
MMGLLCDFIENLLSFEAFTAEIAGVAEKGFKLQNAKLKSQRSPALRN